MGERRGASGAAVLAPALDALLAALARYTGKAFKNMKQIINKRKGKFALSFVYKLYYTSSHA